MTVKDKLASVLDDEWRTGRTLAEMAGVNPRGAGSALWALYWERRAEYRETGRAPSWYSHRPPREYRRPQS